MKEISVANTSSEVKIVFDKKEIDFESAIRKHSETQQYWRSVVSPYADSDNETYKKTN